MKAMKVVIAAAALSLLIMNGASASHIEPVSEGEVTLSVMDSRNILNFDDHGRTIRFMMERNSNDWYELQVTNKGNFFQYGLYWRLREPAIGGLLQKAYVTQYEETETGRYFYSIDLYSDNETTYHSFLIGLGENDDAAEYVNSYYFAGKYIANPHIWARDGKLYLGDKGPTGESSPLYELYWSEAANWFGYSVY